MKRQNSYERTAYKIARYAFEKMEKENNNGIILIKELIDEYSRGVISLHYGAKGEYFKTNLKMKAFLAAELREIFVSRGYENIDYSELIIKPRPKEKCLPDQFKNEKEKIDVVRSNRDIFVLKGTKKYRTVQLIIDRVNKLFPDSHPDEIFSSHYIGTDVLIQLGKLLNDEFIRTDVVLKFISERNGLPSNGFRRVVPILMAFYGYEKFVGAGAQADGRYESQGTTTYIYRKEKSHLTMIPDYILTFKRDNLYKDFVNRQNRFKDI